MLDVMFIKELRDWCIILLKTGMVTLLVALGFTFCEFIGLPVWASSLGLLPAGYVFCKLSGMPVPSVRKWGPQIVGLGLWVGLMSLVLPRLEEGVYRNAAWVLFLAISGTFLRLIPEWPSKRGSEEVSEE